MQFPLLRSIADWIWTNRQWVFDGFGVVLIAALVAWLFKRKRNETAERQLLQMQNNSGALSIQQESSSNSTVIQVNNHGMTLAEVRDVALLVFKDNFPKLRKAANDAARRRVNHFIAELDNKLSRVSPEHLQTFSTPEIQHALNSSVQAAALNDDSALRKILAELLCQRVQAGSNLSAIVYTEAISTVGKLTPGLLNILALHVLLSRSNTFNLTSWDEAKAFFSNVLKPLLSFNGDNSEFEHLVYCGCGSVASVRWHVDTRFIMELRPRAPRLFQRHFTRENLLRSQCLSDALIDRNFETLADTDKMRFKFDCQADFENENKTNFPEVLHMKNLYVGAMGEPQENLEQLLNNAPEYAAAVEKWDSTLLARFDVSSVGFMIGRTHLESVTGVRILNAFEPQFHSQQQRQVWL